MIKDIPNEANIIVGRINEGMFSSNITYSNINGFYKLIDKDYVLIYTNVKPRII